MGFFSGLTKFVSKVFSAADDTVQKIKHLKDNPGEALALKEDLLTPRDVTLKGMFKKLDPVIDTLSPSHNIIQEWSTGSKTTEGQSPYFEKIAPAIVNLFLPGVGSAAAAVSDANEGNTKGAITNTAGAVIGYYGNGAGKGTSFFGVSGQTLGQVVGAASTGYAAYSAFNHSGDLIAQFQDTSKMPQPIQPVYDSGAFGTPYGAMTQSASPVVQAGVIRDAEMAQKKQDYLLSMAFIAIVGYYVLKGK